MIRQDKIIFYLFFSGLRVSVSNMGGATQWRKESVTIIESQEPMDEENEGDVESDGPENPEKEEKSKQVSLVSDKAWIDRSTIFHIEANIDFCWVGEG